MHDFDALDDDLDEPSVRGVLNLPFDGMGPLKTRLKVLAFALQARNQLAATMPLIVNGEDMSPLDDGVVSSGASFQDAILQLAAHLPGLREMGFVCEDESLWVRVVVSHGGQPRLWLESTTRAPDLMRITELMLLWETTSIPRLPAMAA